MSGSRPERVLDPVCGMTVRVADAEAAGLTSDHEGRTYAFCRAGCQRAFVDEPAVYAGRADEAVIASAPISGSLPVIDEGMRRWYESCSCCLSDAYPEIKAALDAERLATAGASVEPGICDVAEARELTAP
ncbi:MAG TPA: YHS domain-containing protein [Candidatus Limnocylindrales bacterium]|nr:YHS domain-containing protein [Candidatus Limnocylindrales bacterium]